MSAAHVALHRERQPIYARIDLVDVRAANTLIVHFDFDRDGWVLESPTKMGWAPGEDTLDERLEEVGFVPAYSEAAAAEVDRINGR